MAYLARARAAAILAALITLALALSWAGAQENTYRFEAVTGEIKVGDNVPVAVRLIGPDGKTVPAKTIELQSMRLDMGPDNMAAMEATLVRKDSPDPGTIALGANIAMAGRWALRLEAAIAGSAETVTGELILTAVASKDTAKAQHPKSGQRKIAYYRNPMGLPDISKVPKKDTMGMDYIPVYEDELSGTPGTVRVSIEKIQRSGVRTALVERRKLTKIVRGAGMIAPDETRIALSHA